MKRVSKIYTIRERSMTEPRWAALARVYASLPGFLGYSPVDGCPCWFGWPRAEGGEKGAPHLWASVEPGGLQVEGELPPDDWAAWDVAFMAAASEALGFPVRDVEDD